MSFKRYVVTLCLALCCALLVQAQRRNARYLNYIDQYSSLAVEQMQKHGIPASIKLAQGLLESGAGVSTLASKSHNHFGIKCGGNWGGPSVRHTDDAPNECFRAYKHPRESYEDHSLFLKRGPRYAFLFDLDVTDYKAWARGLKKAGYATDPSYANRLISIIEDYELYRFDKPGKHRRVSKQVPTTARAAHQVYIANGLAYVVARWGDTFESLEQEVGIKARKLMKYNDWHKGYTLVEGDIVYLKKKKKRAMRPHEVYIVRDGDSMHSIAQTYGIRLKNLYEMNRKDGEYVPEVGDRLRLR